MGAGAGQSRLRVIVLANVLVKKRVSIPTVQTQTRVRGSVPDSALHPMEHCLCVPCRIASAADGAFDPRPCYRPRIVGGKRKNRPSPLLYIS